VNCMPIDRNSFIVSSHRALIGTIPKTLRGLTVGEEYNTLYWRAFFDDQPTEKEKNILSLALNRITADFPSIQHIKEEYIFIPSSFRIDALDYWIFLRWEENL
jgi:hypothetical protein